MKLPDKDRVLSYAVVLALAAVLIVLAVLQYRWSGQVSEAASDRMKASLQASMVHFQDGLAHELGGIALSLQFDAQASGPEAYASQVEQWKQTAAYPDLISNVYIWHSAGNRSRFQRLNLNSLKFEACAAPAGFERLTEPLQEFASRAASREQGRAEERMLAAGPRPEHVQTATLSKPTQNPSEPASAEVARAIPQNRIAQSPAPVEQAVAEPSAPETPRPEPQPTEADSTQTAQNVERPSQEPAAQVLPPRTRTVWSSRWGSSLSGVRASDRQPERSGMFSAFGSSGNRQLNSPTAAPIRRAVAVQSRRTTAFGTDSESPFNRPFIVPERLFGGAEREAAPPLRWRGANLAAWEFFAENWPPEDRYLSPLPPPGTSPLRGPSQTTRSQQEQRGESGQWRVRFSPWFVETGVPALLRPKLSYARHGTVLRSMASGDWIVIELNRKVLQERLFPELVERSFSGHEGLIYDIAVKSVARNELIYSSASGFGRDSGASADAQLGIFGSSGGASGPMRVFFAEDRGPQPLPARDGPRWARRHMGPALIPLQATDGWELLARHRKGSLEAAVAALRRRNLGISFGVLLVLGVTMAMVMVTARRAQRLATLQMDFVAGVSHELRTPLAVISSAADNIADGIVSDKTRLARYGKLIRDHSRQLTHLVEQILSFAASRQQNQNYNLVRVPPSEFIEAALRNSAETIRNAGVTLEQQIEAGLPEVAVDVSVAARCLQNLISNAVKYGGEQRWVGVRARAVKGGVRISVEDRGIGIEAQELEHIFDPFYRAPGVVAAQIHGTGLGLALARSMAESLGGRLTATSKPGQGSTFVLELPAADPHGAESV